MPALLTAVLAAVLFSMCMRNDLAPQPGLDSTCHCQQYKSHACCIDCCPGCRGFLYVCTQAILHRNLAYPEHLSPLAVSFLSAALTRDPAARPTSQQLMQHPFIAMHTQGADCS
jgi:serine/threonine protein kinase